MAAVTNYYKIKSLDDFNKPVFAENFALGDDGEFTITFYNADEKAVQIDDTYFIAGLNGRAQTKGRYSLRVYENWIFLGITHEDGL